MKIYNLKCCGEIFPLQVDRRRANFSWNLKAEENSEKQSAYRILVRDDQFIVWDSGKVASEDNLYIPYAGEELTASTSYRWKVTVYDEKGTAIESEDAFFETGLDVWDAEWIGYDEPVDGKVFDRNAPFYCADDFADGINDYFLPPAPYLRREFVAEKTVKKAKLYYSAFGLADVQINGQVISEALFAPGIANYAETVFSKAVDVTPFVEAGLNAISIILGDGWYAGYIGLNNREWYGSKPRAMAQLEITYMDGTTDKVVTDGTWKAAYGGVREADVFEGAKFDATLEPKGWRTVFFDDSSWAPVETGAEIPLTPTPHPGVDVVVHERIPCAEIIQHKENIIRLRFDRYICGVLNLKVRGTRGSRIVINHTEILNEAGELHHAGNRSARNQDEYVLSGEGEETFAPLFTYHGFRYADIQVFGEVELIHAEGVQMGTKLLDTTRFASNNEMVNTVFDMVLATEKANLFDVPTDCTARDERLGWGMEGNHFLFAMTYMNNQYRMIHKWAKDIWDGQRENGSLEAIAPTMMMKDVEGFVGDLHSNFGVYMVYALYKMYGDLQAVRDYFPKMLKYYDFMERNSDRLIRTTIGCDWLSIWEETGHSDIYHGYGDCAPTVLGTAHYALVVKMMIEMCKGIGEKEYEEKFRALHHEILRTMRMHYIMRDGSLRFKKQNDYLISLAAGVFEGENEEKALDFFINKLTQSGYVRWFGGTPTTPFFLGTLKNYGRDDLANEFLAAKTFPSIGYMHSWGFDTIWERWDGFWEDGTLHPQVMNAFSHEGYAVVGAYLTFGVAGIETIEGGFKKIRIQPGLSKDITSCKCAYDSARGTIGVDWEWNDGVFDIAIEIPANTTAEIVLPCTEENSLVGEASGIRYADGKVTAEIASGKYHFKTKAALA